MNNTETTDTDNSIFRIIILVSILVITVLSVSGTPLINPSSTSNGCSGSLNYSDCFDQLVTRQNDQTLFNTTKTFTIGGQSATAVPWYSSSTACGISNLQSGGNCNIGTVDFNTYCMVSDEFSQDMENAALSSNQTLFQQYYVMTTKMNATYGQLPGWRCVVNQTGSYVDCKRSGVNGNGDSASDADARIVYSLFVAANNSYFTNATQKNLYYQLGVNLSRDMYANEVVHQCFNSTLGSGQICEWAGAGSNVVSSGMGGNSFQYTGYLQDIIKAFLAAYKETGNLTYLLSARNFSLQWLQSANFTGNSFVMPPGKAFHYSTSNIIAPIAVCDQNCGPPAYTDSVDAVRFFGQGMTTYLANLSNTTLPNMTQWGATFNTSFLNTSTSSVFLEFYTNGTGHGSSQSGYMAQGLQALAAGGFEQFAFETIVRSGLSHYSSGSSTWDSTACFGSYNQAFVMQALGSGIGRDALTFSGNTPTGSSATITGINATIVSVLNQSTITVASALLNVTFYNNNATNTTTATPGSLPQLLYNWTGDVNPTTMGITLNNWVWDSTNKVVYYNGSDFGTGMFLPNLALTHYTNGYTIIIQYRAGNISTSKFHYSSDPSSLTGDRIMVDRSGQTQQVIKQDGNDFASTTAYNFGLLRNASIFWNASSGAYGNVTFCDLTGGSCVTRRNATTNLGDTLAFEPGGEANRYMNVSGIWIWNNGTAYNVTTLSPTNSTMNVSFYAINGSLIYSQTGVTNGTSVNFTWPVTTDGTYQWYVFARSTNNLLNNSAYQFLVNTSTPFSGNYSIQPANVQACYAFENNGNDASVYGRNLTTTGTITYSTGKIGNASGGFGLTSPLYTIASSTWENCLQQGNNCTVAFWLNTTDKTKNQAVFAKRGDPIGVGDFQLYIDGSSGKLTLDEDSSVAGGVQSFHQNTAITNNAWTFYVVRMWSNGSVEFWMNNAVDGGGTYSLPADGNGRTLYIGSHPNINPVIGKLDEMTFWNATLGTGDMNTLYNTGNGLSCNSIISGATTPQYLVVTVTNAVDGSLVNGFCATQSNAAGYTYTNCTSGTVASLSNTGVWNLSISNISGGTFFNITQNNYNFSTTTYLTPSTVQSYLNVSAAVIFTNTSISVFNVTNNKLSNTTGTGALIGANNGTNNLQISVAGNYTINYTCTGGILITSFCNVTGVYDSLYNFTASALNVSVNSFTINVTNSTLGGQLYYTSTTNGTISFPLLRGYNYTFTLTSDQYTATNTTFLVNSPGGLYNFGLTAGNTFEFTFINETSGNRLTNVNITVQIISNLYATNSSTSNGSLIVPLLIPANYTIRYWKDPSVPRDYYVTLNNLSYVNLSLYVLDADISTTYLPIIYNDFNRPISGAIVELLRYYVQTNSYVVVEMETTDTNGQAVLRVVPNVINYKLLVSSGTNTMMTAPTKFTASTNSYTLSSSSNYLTSLVTIPSVQKSLYFNNPTNTYIFTWSDTSNIVTSGCMQVTQYNNTGQYNVYSNCQSGSVGSLIYTVLDTNNSRYSATAALHTNTQFSTYYFGPVSFSYDNTPAFTFGLTGLIILIIVLVTVGFLANEHGTDTMIFTTVIGMFLLGIIGIVAYSWEAYVGIAIIGAIIVYKIYG